jgi:hypothetical protein
MSLYRKAFPCLVDRPDAVHRHLHIRQLGHVADRQPSRSRLRRHDLGFDLVDALVIPVAEPQLKLFGLGLIYEQLSSR